MVSKTHKGIVGYGASIKEAEDSCKIISIFQNAYNIRDFNGLENERLQLAPWAPKTGTLHTKKAGYIKCSTSSDGVKHIKIGDIETPISSSLFSTLYRAFFCSMSMLDIALCSDELRKFFIENGIIVKDFSSYNPLIPEDVFLEDNDIKTVVIFSEYTIIMYNSNKVSMKRNTEEMYWTCYYNKEDTSSIIDTIYYIAYMRSYSGITDIVKEDFYG